MNHAFRAAIALRYPVVTRLEDWVLPEGKVPESAVHDAVAQHLRLLLEAWSEHQGELYPDAPQVQIARNLAVRWLESAPNVGIDPDVCVLSPPPPEGALVDSVCLWKKGHEAPLLSFEIVSKGHPHKDYGSVHERYAAMGAFELVVFDPLMVGPKALGGPVSLQVWRRDDTGVFERIHFGPGPAYSEVLEAWLFSTGHHLVIASDRDGVHLWRTGEERERAEKERERTARIEAERKLAELEKRLG